MIDIRIDGSHVVFESENGQPARTFPLNSLTPALTITNNAVVLEFGMNGTLPFRDIFKFDRYGNQILKMHVYTQSALTIADDNCSYSLDGLTRVCGGPVWTVQATANGDLVILEPSSVSDPSRNLMRFNSDGSIRWRLAQRDYRPNDRILGAYFLPNGNVLARAYQNGWAGEVDDRTGIMIRFGIPDR